GPAAAEPGKSPTACRPSRTTATGNGVVPTTTEAAHRPQSPRLSCGSSRGRHRPLPVPEERPPRQPRRTRTTRTGTRPAASDGRRATTVPRSRGRTSVRLPGLHALRFLVEIPEPVQADCRPAQG